LTLSAALGMGPQWLNIKIGWQHLIKECGLEVSSDRQI